jgi:large subunit ribosomal protein L4e
MRVAVLSLEGKPLRETEIPPVFATPIRPDVIHRAFIALASHAYQPQGRDPFAGERTSALSWGVGRGAARMARVKGERHPRAGQAAGVASVVHGRIAHPPRAEKRIHKLLNRKERWLATASAIAATADPMWVARRGHLIAKVPRLPLVVSDELQAVARGRDLRPVLQQLGLTEDLARAKEGRHRRSGKPRMRGRVTRVPRGPLFVVGEDAGLGRAVGAFPGTEQIRARDVSVLQLAPGGVPGRLTVWTESALQQLTRGVREAAERTQVLAAVPPPKPRAPRKRPPKRAPKPAAKPAAKRAPKRAAKPRRRAKAKAEPAVTATP